MHLLLRVHHPLFAWGLTAASVSALGWLGADYKALGRGTIRIERETLDIRVGQRFALQVPLSALAMVVRPAWQEIPASGTGSADYRNLLKPATPNVLVTLIAPTMMFVTPDGHRSTHRQWRPPLHALVSRG